MFSSNGVDYNLSHVSIWLTEPKAIILVAVSCVIFVLILLYFLVASLVHKVEKIKQKTPKIILWLFRSSWTTWLATVFAVIIGLIFWGLDGKQNFIYNPDVAGYPFNVDLWVWQSIQFLYATGSWIVTFILFSLWLAVPFICVISLLKLRNDKQNIDYHLRRIFWIVVVMVATLGAANLMWALPMNSQYGSLQIFKINPALQDIYYRSAKQVYESVFLTQWYPWVFLAYSLICLIGAAIYAKDFYDHRYSWIMRRYWFIVETMHAFSRQFKYDFDFNKKVFMYPFTIANWLAAVELYAFMVAFTLFNVDSLWLHIVFILIVCLIAYCFVVLFCIAVGLVKYRDRQASYLKEVGRLFICYLKPFAFKKNNYAAEVIEDNFIQNNYARNDKCISTNMVLNIVVPVAFTVFLGFNNYPEFENFDQIGTYQYAPIMHQVPFWLSLIISGFMFTAMGVGIPDAGTYGKNFVGAATYGVTPGMQTGVLGITTSPLSHFGKWTDANIKLVF